MIELQGGISLAAATGDAGLLTQIRLLARDGDEVVRRLNEPDQVEPVQRTARESLTELPDRPQQGEIQVNF